jgi:hypothetical protein
LGKGGARPDMNFVERAAAEHAIDRVAHGKYFLFDGAGDLELPSQRRHGPSAETPHELGSHPRLRISTSFKQKPTV